MDYSPPASAVRLRAPSSARNGRSEEKLNWLQALVVSQWKSGKSAELQLFSENGHLSVRVSADFGPSSWNVETAGVYRDTVGNRESPSRLRRRQRRAAERAAEDVKRVDAVKAAEEAATEKADAEKAFAKKAVAEKAIAKLTDSEKAVAEKADAEKPAAEKPAAEKPAAEKPAAEKQAAEKPAVEKPAAEMATAGEVVAEKAEFVASTSCAGSQLPAKEKCWNCEGEMSITHQCDIPDTSLKTIPAPAPKAPCGLNGSAEPPLKGAAFLSPLLKSKVPGPSAPVILKKPVKMLDGSPIWTPKPK